MIKKETAAINSITLPVLFSIVFLAFFLVSFLSTNFLTRSFPTRAVIGLGLAGAPTMSLSTSTSSVEIHIDPASSGVLASGSHIATASTNVPTGYNLSLSTTASPSLVLSSGTVAVPLILSNNTWGFAIGRVDSSSIDNTVLNGFDANYTTPTPSPTSKWAGLSTTSTIIKNTLDSTTNSPSTASTSIYYGARADVFLSPGTYNNTVLYTALANLGNIPAPSILSISPSSGSIAGGTAVEIVGTGFTVNDQSVTTAVSIGGVACMGISISSNTPTVGQDTIYCNTPSHATPEAVDIAVTTWRSTATLSGGYTYIMPIPVPTITSPSTNNQIFAAGTTSITLEATTDINAICYYGTAATPTTIMTTTGATSHSVNITGLANQNSYTRYIRCQATTGAPYSTSQSVVFHVRAATPAVPSTSPATGSTANIGAATITVISSGAVCMWGTNGSTYPFASGSSHYAVSGYNFIYYSCVTGSGYTISEARTGLFYFMGQVPTAQPGDYIQTVNSTNCPTTRTRVIDARDNNSYWVQKLSNGQCWMETNLAYAGGGTDTYGDIKTIYSGDASSLGWPYYRRLAGHSNPTTGSTNPSLSTNGVGQYGFMYNWCAAMGGDTSTYACNVTVSGHYPSISICPSGWRIPTTADFNSLNAAVNSGSTSSPSGLLTNWLGMYGGAVSGGTTGQGYEGYYWTSEWTSRDTANAFYFNASQVRIPYSIGKTNQFAVRCITSY